MIKFYKCEVIDCIDIVAIEGYDYTYIYYESEVSGGFDFYSIIENDKIKHVLKGNNLYDRLKRVTYEEATEIIKERTSCNILAT